MKEDHNSIEQSIPTRHHIYTQKQGQYLAFIYYYTKVNGCAPAEADMQRFFRVSPPSVHQMLDTLEKKQLIARAPRKARSITLLVDPTQLPALL